MALRLLCATSKEEYAVWLTKLQPLLASLELSGNAQDTDSLLSMVQMYTPDVILANTRLIPEPMPPILEYLTRTSRIILVSDRSDYTEALTALRCGVYDLLPAPVDDARLLHDLQSIHSAINVLIPGISPIDLKKVIGRLLISYSRRVPADRQLNEREVNRMYGTKFQAGAFRFITICLDSDGPAVNVNPDELLSRCQIAVFNTVAPMCHETILNCDDVRYHVLLNYETEDDEKILELLQQCLKDVQARLPAGNRLTFCCSTLHDTIFEIVSMLDESGNAIWDRLHNGSGAFLICRPHTPCPKDLQQLFENAEQHLKGACATLDLESFQRELTALSLLPYRYKSLHEMRSVLRNTEAYMFNVNRELISSFTDAERTRRDLVLQLRRVSTLEDYFQTYSHCMSTLFHQVLALSHSQQSRPVRQAQQYIRQNYAMPLTLDIVAGQVGLSPVYFSAVFKKETGIGFSDFLNHCRIDQAKKLLEDTGLKVLAISQAVGFSGPRYFSRVFKNMVGVRPSEYRIAMQRSDLPTL